MPLGNRVRRLRFTRSDRIGHGRNEDRARREGGLNYVKSHARRQGTPRGKIEPCRGTETHGAHDQVGDSDRLPCPYVFFRGCILTPIEARRRTVQWQGIRAGGIEVKRVLSLLAGVAALAGAGALQAASINSSGIVIDTSLYPTGLFEVSCDGAGACEGFSQNSPLTLSPIFATAWGGVHPGQGGRLQAGFLDGLLERLDLAPVGNRYTKVDKTVSSFMTKRKHFGIKTGQWIAYLRNAHVYPVIVHLNTKVNSHGEAGAVVPIPPAFLLFGSAVAGLGWLAHRQRARRQRAGVADAA